jgi:hypothetical protein
LERDALECCAPLGAPLLCARSLGARSPFFGHGFARPGRGFARLCGFLSPPGGFPPPFLLQGFYLPPVARRSCLLSGTRPTFRCCRGFPCRVRGSTFRLRTRRLSGVGSASEQAVYLSFWRCFRIALLSLRGLARAPCAGSSFPDRRGPMRGCSSAGLLSGFRSIPGQGTYLCFWRCFRIALLSLCGLAHALCAGSDRRGPGGGCSSVGLLADVDVVLVHRSHVDGAFSTRFSGPKSDLG